MTTKQTIRELSPWFHNIHLPDGSMTAPDHELGDFPDFKWQKISPSIPSDLSGWKVLDIGCNAGFYSVELAKRGAEVLAIDLDAHYLRQAKWIAKQFKLDHQIRFKQMQVYDLAHTEEEFDLVWFMGVFYHLRYPMLALDILSEKTRNQMVFQTLSKPGKGMYPTPQNLELNDREHLSHSDWPSMAFIEHRLAGDPTNWWAPNEAGILSMLRSCGFRVTEKPEDETYIAVKDDTHNSTTTWNYSEYLSAVGKAWQQEVKNKTNK